MKLSFRELFCFSVQWDTHGALFLLLAACGMRSRIEYCDLESEAHRHGVYAETGKKSLQVAKYMRDKLILKGETVVTLEGYDDLLEVWNELRCTHKNISYFAYLIETANEDIQDNPILKEKYGDIPYLQKEYLDNMEALCRKVYEMQGTIFNLIKTMYKQILKLEKNYDVRY